MNLAIEQRHKRLLDMIAEGRLLRGSWQRFDADGNEHACLLAALAPEVADARIAGYCPIEVMPRWLAEITPWIDDRGSEKAWPDVVNRYANLIIAGRGFSPKEWRKLEATWFLTILKEIRSYNPTAVDHVYRLWQQVAAGNEPESTEWLEATRATRATTRITETERIVAEIARMAGIAAAVRAAKTVEKAAKAAKWAVAGATRIAAEAAEAETAAADRIISAFFDAWQIILEDMQ